MDSERAGTRNPAEDACTEVSSMFHGLVVKQHHSSKFSLGSKQASPQDLGVEDCFEACFEDAVDIAPPKEPLCIVGLRRSSLVARLKDPLSSSYFYCNGPQSTATSSHSSSKETHTHTHTYLDYPVNAGWHFFFYCLLHLFSSFCLFSSFIKDKIYL